MRALAGATGADAETPRPAGATEGVARRRIAVEGQVQGVGFRPFVRRLAESQRLAGWVRNTATGVEIEVEGGAAGVLAMIRLLRSEAPPLARVERVESHPLDPTGEAGFRIAPSEPSPRAGPVRVPPDVAACAACVREIEDPRERRFRYPFTNCTDCGPRFTIVRALPYDRGSTTMSGFPLCAECRAEYLDPADRRFHAEPIACPACGPRLSFVPGPLAPDLAAGGGDAAIAAAAAALRAGRIVAVKGLGGFQLACDATRPDAVRLLRERKAREARPFAVMVGDLAAARALCEVDEAEADLLAGPRAPIVLLRRRREADAPALAPGVAPGLGSLGIMLPSTPLHHLLLRAFGGPLVMTSGNRSAEPIATGNEEARERLSDVADAFLVHDREIVSRYDDSVARVDGGRAVVLRRARGYAPEPIRLPRRARAPILAMGAQLKSTFCLVREDRAYPSQHIGDLDDAATLAHFHQTLALYRRLFGIDPGVVAHDLHPDYAGTRLAGSMDGTQRIGVQHHHAHVVSCLAEHGVEESAIGVAFDGAGYGPDGAVWGGELMVASWTGFRRVAHLEYLPLPGGDAAAREPWRMAVAAIARAYGEEAAAVVRERLPGLPAERTRAVLSLARSGRFAPPTSSAGRLFDAVAALAGVRERNLYEGQAAMELEAAADSSASGSYPLPLAERGPGSPAVWEVAPLVRAVVDDLRGGAAAGVVAARFHDSLARAVLEGCLRVREREGIELAALSGGCFQNARLLRGTRAGLEGAGFRVLSHARVPPNDGGVSLGQAAVALATLAG